LLDTYKSLGLYLTASPYLEYLVNTSQESRVVVSPDGQKLALVLIDKPGLVRQKEQFTFSTCLFEIPSNKLTFLSQGASPIWSPDGKRLTFVRGDTTPDGFVWDSGLWVADLQTGKIYPLIRTDPTNPALFIRYWMWSSDSQQITYRYSEGLIDKHEIWIKSVADSSSPYLIPNISADIYYWCFSWMPDGQNLLCGTQDGGRPDSPTKLWAVSVNTGERKQLNQGFYGGAGPWSPDRKWLAFSAVRPYEREEETYDYDIWLLSADGIQLKRVTSAPPQSIGEYWSPDGTRLVFRREGAGLMMLSLQTGNVTSLGVNLIDLASYNYAVGGSK
jgi:Tol biopolymer transport system component